MIKGVVGAGHNAELVITDGVDYIPPSSGANLWFYQTGYTSKMVKYEWEKASGSYSMVARMTTAYSDVYVKNFTYIIKVVPIVNS